MNRTVLMSVMASLVAVALVAGLGVGGYAYHHQTSHVAKLKTERSVLTAELSRTEAKVLATQLKLGKGVRSLNKAKRNITQMSKDLTAANKRADANYSAGYSSGTNNGYSSGLYAGSDSLTCSDDATVTWLPYCN
jgi:peptidoglycan hydrolase CwlO-like protein